MTDQPAGTPSPSLTTDVPWYERPVEPAGPAAPAAVQAPVQAPVVTPPRAETAVLPVQPAPAAQPAQPAHAVQRAPGGAAPWVPAPRPAESAPAWLGGAPAGPSTVPPAAGAQPGGRGMVVWAAVGALVAAALVAAGVVWGPALWDGETASDASASSPSAVADTGRDTGNDTGNDTDSDRDPAPPEDEAVPELPTLGEDDGTGDDATGADPTPPGTEPTTPAGDLGLDVLMTPPTCDGSWTVFVGAATDAARYAADVQTLLDAHPAARYTLTQGGCSSMRQQLPDGTLIYAVWAGPYPDQASACAARTQFGEGAYVKRMDNSTPPDQLWQC